MTVGGQTCPRQTIADNKITCVIPAGQGQNVNVLVTVASQTSNAATFSYKPPTISLVNPLQGPTIGGIAVRCSKHACAALTVARF